MATAFQMKSSGPPAGAHPAEFVRIEPFEGGEKSKDYGPAVALVWRVTDGEHKDLEVTCVASAKMSQKSKLGKLAVALKGGSIKLGESIDFASFYGTVGTLVVEEVGEGATRVTTFAKTGKR